MKKSFPNIHQFRNWDINKVVLLLWKGVYPYVNTWIAWKDLIKPHYLIKKAFYSELNLEDIDDKDYAHAQNLFEEFKLKSLGNYHDYVQSDTLLLPDVFESFRCKWIET